VVSITLQQIEKESQEYIRKEVHDGEKDCVTACQVQIVVASWP